MSREILFKAKRIDNGEWVKGDLVHSVYKINDTCIGKYGSNIGMHQVDENTICQYTGLTDKNGNKIWENDVVKNAKYENYKAIVHYGAFNCSCCNGVYGWTFESIGGYSQVCDIRKPSEVEVIGNVFDNPELLKGE